MKIIPATQNHLQSIATLMVKEYQKLNDDLSNARCIRRIMTYLSVFGVREL